MAKTLKEVNTLKLNNKELLSSKNLNSTNSKEGTKKEEDLNITSEESWSQKNVKSRPLSNNSNCHSEYNWANKKPKLDSDGVSDVMSEENMRFGLDINIRSSFAINT